jgi:hypothetical protein
MYHLVNPPFERSFKEMSGKELRAYFDWVLASVPERMKELKAEVHRTPGYESWEADSSPISLDTLGRWFSSQVEVRPLTDEETAQNRSTVPEKMSFLLDELPARALNYRTLSLVFDVGLYLSQVILKTCDGVSWQQVRSGKTYHDYGQPVLVGLSLGRCSPLLLVDVLAEKIADGEEAGNGLRKIYDIWSKKK